MFLTEENVSLIEKIVSSLGIESSTAVVIISIAVILFFGFLMTRVTKRLKLPNVTAYIIVGVLLVPIWKLIPAGISGIIPARVVNGMDFISDIALAFIAFSAGEYFKIGELKKSGRRVLIITLFEAFAAFILVFIVCFFLLGIDISFSLVLAALSSATAPASTIMTIKQTKAKGEYVNTLLEVVAVDDVISLVLYSVAIALCLALANGGSGISFESIGLPILKNLLTIVIGFGFGFLLKLLLPKTRTKDNRLIIAIALLFTFCGICALLEQSPLLGCMVMSMVYINISGDEKLFKQLNYFSPPIMLLFFVMSGMKFNLLAFTNMTTIGYVPLFVAALVYFFVRIVGKYGGAYLGCATAKTDKKVRNYLGLGLVPQAGVAIGLSYMGARIFTAQGQPELGDSLQTIILASSVLYELVGPGLSKLGLYLSGSYKKEDETPVLSTNDVVISETSNIDNLDPKIDVTPEDAYNEAAEQYYEENDIRHNKRE